MKNVVINTQKAKYLALLEPLWEPGSGKSTLLHMMGRLDTPTSGTVIVWGEELAKKNDEQLTIFCRRSISLENIQRIADALNIEAYKLLLENRKGTENDK